jgi:hypothetical protein
MDGKKPEKLGVCFGFSITDKPNGDVDVKLAFSGTEEDSSRQSIPDQSKAAVKNIEQKIENEAFYRYTKMGYSLLHNWISNHVLRVISRNPQANIAVTVIPFKFDERKGDDY